MNNIFKLHRTKLICGKNRYIKINKKTSKLSKTEYIKYKGEYIKLNTFIKEYNKNNKKGINHGKKNVIIINNIKDIKDKKVRDFFNKTFKKNAKIYIYTDKKLLRGGGAFKDDVSRNNDIVAPRAFSETNIVGTFHAIPHDPIPYPYNIKIDYNSKYDDIIDEILKIGKTKLFEIINNLEYTIVVEDTTFVIRPFIDFAPYKKFYLYFYINMENFNDTGTQKWIKLPIHISLFLKDMIDKFDKTSLNIKCLTTGHIHISSDDKIGTYNISTLLDSTKINRKTSATVSISTHTYLIAGNLQQATHIMKTHRKEIFKDWFYDKTNEEETRALVSSLFIPSNNKWGPIPSIRGNNTIILSSNQKKLIYVCFDKLQYIISNILHIMDKQTVSVHNLETSVSGIVMKDNYKVHSSDRVKPADYLTYTIPNYPSNINIRYKFRDETRRKGLIDETDVDKASVNKGPCPGTYGHSARSRDAHSLPLPRFHSPHRSLPLPRFHSPHRSLPLPRSHSPHRAHPTRRLPSLPPAHPTHRLPSPPRAHPTRRLHSPPRPVHRSHHTHRLPSPPRPVHYSPRSRSPPVRRIEREIISHVRSRSPPARRRTRY